MEMDSFIKNFSSIFDETDPNDIKAGSVFREFDEWSSLLALSLMAMIEEEYNVKLTGQDIQSSSTVEDIYNITQRKLDNQ